MIPQYNNPTSTIPKLLGAAALPEGYRLLGPGSTHPEIIYQDNFLSADECDQLVQCFDRYQKITPKSGNGDPFFDHRVLRFAKIPDHEEICKSTMQKSRLDTAEIIRSFHGRDADLYSDDIQLVKWSPGQPMVPHADNAHPDGGPHNTPYREFASIVYLNDDFVGGYLYIEALKVAVSPKKGLLVAFKGGMEHKHGVTEILSGGRYTLAAWFTHDESRRDSTELSWERRHEEIDVPVEFPAVQSGGEQTGSIVSPSDTGLNVGLNVGLKCYALLPTPPKMVAARPHRSWMDDTAGRHAYKCLPMTIANTYGWEILSPCSFSVEWNGGLKAKDLTITVEDDYPYLESFAESNFAHGIVTFHVGYLFQTDPGWHMIATGPFNNPKHGIAPLTGVIETDWLPYPFTMNWHMTEPGKVRFEKDEPYCLVYPVAQGVLETIAPEIHTMEENPKLKEEHEIWRKTRADFRHRLDEKEPEAVKQSWQRYYYKGEIPETGAKAPSHSHKVRLMEPIDRRK